MPMLKVQLDPIDPLLFGDSRSTRAGEDHDLVDQDPSPATLYGAIGARIAACLKARGETAWSPAEPVLGPFVADLAAAAPRRSELLGVAVHDPGGARWLPRPRHHRVMRLGTRRVALPPLRPGDKSTSVPSSLVLPRRLTAADPEEAPRGKEEEELWVREDLLAEMLAGSTGAASDVHSRSAPAEAFARPEFRAGLALSNATGTAVSGRLFSRPYRRFRGAVAWDSRQSGFRPCGYTAWLEVLSLAGHACAQWDGTGFLGGDRRRARLRFEEPQGAPLQGVLEAVLEAVAGSAGFVAYLLTPAVVEAGKAEAGDPSPHRLAEWLSIEAHAPLAAALGRPSYASGWCAAGKEVGPRPLIALIPAGSVLFFEWGKGEATADERKGLVKRLWCQPLTQRYRYPGFGRLLVGVWR